MPVDPAALFSEAFSAWAPPLTIPEGVTFRHAVPYGTGGGHELTADLFLPPAEFTGPRPAMLYIYGGGWQGGNPGQFYRQAARLAAKGIVGVCNVYRLSGEAIFPAAVEDCKCAVRWMRASAEELAINPDRIGVAGGSAGGHLAAMVATTAGVPELEGEGGHAEFSSAVKLAVPFNPITDCLNFFADGSEPPPWTLKFLGGTPDEQPDAYHLASPVEFVGPDTPPCLVPHGTGDVAVPHDHAIRFADAMAAAGRECELVLAEGEPHGFFNWEPSFEPIYARFEKFVLGHI